MGNLGEITPLVIASAFLKNPEKREGKLGRLLGAQTPEGSGTSGALGQVASELQEAPALKEGKAAHALAHSCGSVREMGGRRLGRGWASCPAGWPCPASVLAGGTCPPSHNTRPRLPEPAVGAALGCGGSACCCPRRDKAGQPAAPAHRLPCLHRSGRCPSCRRGCGAASQRGRAPGPTPGRGPSWWRLHRGLAWGAG